MELKIKASHKLRKPTGPHPVGASGGVYEYRLEEGDSPKLLPWICFYPARDKGAGELKKYASEKIVPGTAGIETNSYSEAPIAEGQHPFILFNHGFSVGLETNTVQFEELASHGYIVLSVGHQGDGSYELPGGEFSMFDMENMLAKYAADAEAGAEWFTKYGDWLAGEGVNASLDEQRDFYKNVIEPQPNMMAHTEVWTKDSLVAFELFSQEARFAGHIDRAKIGALGMSYGGSTAMSLAQESELIRAAANLDGFFYSPRWQQPVNKPVMLMHHDGLGGLFLTYPFLIAPKDAYLVTVKDTTHGNFVDYNEVVAENPLTKITFAGREVEYGALGRIDPDRMETIMNELLLDFFNKYLLGQPAQIIDGDNLPEEIILRRK